MSKKKPYVITQKEFHEDPRAACAPAGDRDIMIVDENGKRRMYMGTVRLDENRWDVQTFDQAAFDRLKSEIRHDPNLMLSSNLQDTYEHPAYQDLIDAGTDALSYLLRDLQEEPYWWFEAIDEIVGPQNVPDVPDDLKGRLNDLADLYIEWGRNQGYLHE